MSDQLLPAGSNRYRAQINWLISFCLTLIMAVGATLAIHGSLAQDKDPAQTLTFATSAAMFALVFVPFGAASPGHLRKLLSWAVLSGALCALQSVISQQLYWPHTLLLAGTVTLFVLAAGGLMHAMALRTNDALAIAVIVAVTLDLCAAPIYLGPIAEHLSTHRLFVDAVVNISPVTHFAAALGFDYLRGSWFYKYSPVGSLRFDYATPAACAIGYALAALLSQYLISIQLRQWENTRR